MCAHGCFSAPITCQKLKGSGDGSPQMAEGQLASFPHLLFLQALEEHEAANGGARNVEGRQAQHSLGARSHGETLCCLGWGWGD